jgi:hypothetical protein
MTRSPQGPRWCASSAASRSWSTAFDRDAVIAAVRGGPAGRRGPPADGDRPSSTAQPDGSFAATNRLRTEGTDNLLAGAARAGVRRIVAQSYAGWPYAREGGPAKAEDDPLDPTRQGLRETLAAIRHLEAAVTGTDGIEGIVLRYGGFYGPGTGLGARAATSTRRSCAASLPAHGQRVRRVVARADRRCRATRPSRRSSRAPARDLQRRRRRAGARARVGCRRSRRPSARSRRGACPGSSGGSSSARRATR